MSEAKLATKADLKEMYDRMLPYMGGMPEVLANKFSKGDLYDTTEKMIGQWIDGKPIYQKTVVKTGLSGTIGNFTIIFSDNSIDKTVNIVGQCFFNDGYNTSLPFNTYSENSGNFYFRFFTNNANNQGKILVYWKDTYDDMTKATMYFTVQYTKTNDSAISIGSDTDYSTDEKIVGTWIGGKTIYQKTLNNITVPKNSTSALIENVDLLVDCKLTYVRGGVRTTNQAFYNSASDMVLVIPAVNESTHSFYIYWNSPYTLSDFNITVQYTKTT